MEVMTTLHGSTPFPWRCAEDCIPPRGMIVFVKDPLTYPFLFYKATSTLYVSLDPIKISFLHVGAFVDL